ncbi:hypothetical protein NDU88_000400 [Pleurodeles waltl]|uniref:Uncharacterized protein n=1 Tax=Pleurodeles waltl TaxID=8319 RepID=A0AAV7VTD2_PLEWA|nr:hypothetical protein NDU88_000400 [Pleurodeles waltl]
MEPWSSGLGLLMFPFLEVPVVLEGCPAQLTPGGQARIHFRACTSGPAALARLGADTPSWAEPVTAALAGPIGLGRAPIAPVLTVTRYPAGLPNARLGPDGSPLPPGTSAIREKLRNSGCCQAGSASDLGRRSSFKLRMS